jgi:transposase InsO family protein
MTNAQRHNSATSRGDGDRKLGGAITARRKLSIGPLYRPAVRVPLAEEPVTKTTEAHSRGEELLGAALAEQRRTVERYEAATGHPGHLAAEVAVHAADQEVAARQAWLRWVDDEHYHGLNAGPFELFAEDSEL